jgi:lysophospholipase L1-like esterase
LGAHPEYLSADGYHPSALGYKRLAEVIAEQVASKI